MSTVSPLLEVERAVQERAKEVALDMATPEGAARLRALVDEEVARWSEDYKRGLRSIDIADAAAVAERAFRNVAGYGPLAPLLADDDVWEIMVNGPDAIFVKRHKGPSGYHDEVFHDDDHVVRTLTKILDDATGSHRKLDPAEGLQDAQLDTGARIHIVHGDVGRDGHLLVNIRKFTGIAYRSLHELVERDMLDGRVAGFLRACVRARLSMVIAGAPGSGKTTLLSCCAAELDPSLRVVVAEEVFEADVPLPNVARGTCGLRPRMLGPVGERAQLWRHGQHNVVERGAPMSLEERAPSLLLLYARIRVPRTSGGRPDGIVRPGTAGLRTGRAITSWVASTRGGRSATASRLRANQGDRTVTGRSKRCTAPEYRAPWSADRPAATMKP